MSVPVDGSPVPGEHRVLRLPVPPKDFIPGGWKPTHQELEPSGDDKRDAAEHGGPVRVSVWDAALTTAAEARAFRSRPVIAIAARFREARRRRARWHRRPRPCQR
jgi:hypothetical protein